MIPLPPKTKPGSIQATHPSRLKAVQTGDRIADVVFSGLISASQPPSKLYGGGANIPVSQFMCDVTNRANGYPALRDVDFHKECLTWFASTPSPETLSGHYGEHRLEMMQNAIWAARRLGWSDVEQALEHAGRVPDLSFLSMFTVDRPLGHPRNTDQHYGPTIVHCDGNPSSYERKAFAVACVGFRGDHFYPQNGHWIDIPAWQGKSMREIAVGVPLSEMSRAIAARAKRFPKDPKVDPDWMQLDIEARRTIVRAMRDHKDALEDAWRIGRAAVRKTFRFELIRTMGGLMARWLGTPGGKTMKGPRPVWIILLEPDKSYATGYVITSVGTASWPEFETTADGRYVAHWPTLQRQGDLAQPALTGDLLLHVKYDEGAIEDSLPEPNPEPPTEKPAPEPDLPPAIDDVMPHWTHQRSLKQRIIKAIDDAIWWLRRQLSRIHL